MGFAFSESNIYIILHILLGYSTYSILSKSPFKYKRAFLHLCMKNKVALIL
jgi:hypothetical protein